MSIAVHSVIITICFSFRKCERVFFSFLLFIVFTKQKLKIILLLGSGVVL
jgi:hypothetical protein